MRDQVAAARRQGVDWRPVVDGLRAPTQGLWQRLHLAERRRFLTTYAREWEVRRHRMATEVAARLEGYRDDARLTVLKGGLASVTDHGPRCEVGLPALPDTLFADAVVNCTGPMTDVRAAPTRCCGPWSDAAWSSLTCSSWASRARPRVRCSTCPGRSCPGSTSSARPCRRTLWETTAVPEIRSQAAALARRLPEHVRGRLPA